MCIATSRIAATLLSSLLLSCASDSYPKLSGAQEALLKERKSETELGRSMAGRILQFYGTYKDEKLLDYIYQVGLHVAKYSGAKDREFRFEVLDTEDINAFACPGAYIFVTKGLVQLLQNEAELAAVLGHEIAHVNKRHLYNTILAKQHSHNAGKRQSLDSTAGVRQRPSHQETYRSSELIARYLSGATATGMSLLVAAKQGMELMLETGLDKKLEFEADAVGIRYAIRAGYEPFALRNFLSRLAKHKQDKHMKILSRTHPRPRLRNEKLNVELSGLNANDIVGARGKVRFAQMTRGIRTHH